MFFGAKTRSSGLFFVALFLAAPLPAFDGPRLYDLRQGSFIRDECVFCDRAPIERPLKGTFVLERTAIGDVREWFELSNLEASDEARDYVVEGGGIYALVVGSELSHEITLDVAINGQSPIKLQSDTVPSGNDWPAFEIEATEDGTRDPFHQYTIHIAAAPQVEMVRYELLDGSIFIDDCEICGRPTIPVPVAGSFLMGELDGGANPIVTYRVDEVRISSIKGDPPYTITGRGTYRQGGEVALLQQMNLVLQVNDFRDVQLGADAASPPVVFPDLDVQLVHRNPASPLHVFSLHILAEPAGKPSSPFRRGDVNDDAKVDISDAVGILYWLFLGESDPGCLEAVDSDGNGAHEITDAISLLDYLFQGGLAPPAPGPDACGRPVRWVFGCENISSCAGG